MKIIFLGIGVMLVSFAFLQSCTYDKEVLLPFANCPDTLNVSFSAKVRPLLQVNCFSCHGNGIREGNISLETYDQVKQMATNGRLLGSITHTRGYEGMPQGADKLMECDIAIIGAWVKEGIKNN